MSWLWPSQLNNENSVAIRAARVIHWCFAAFAIFGLVVTSYAILSQEDVDPVAYFVLPFTWVAVAMIGRGVRYIIARE